MEKGFHEIYEKYSTDLYSFIIKLCGNEQLAKDIMQDTMLRAFTHFDQYNGNCNIKTWLCTIAKNVYFDHLRKSESRNTSLDTAENAAVDSFEQSLTDSDTAIRIHHLLHELDEPYREVLLLRIFAELKFSDIGSVFGKSENWAGLTYYRGKRKLIELMKKEGLL